MKEHANKGKQYAMKGDKPLDTNINIRISKELKEQAQATAKAKKKTFSQWLIDLITRGVAK